MMFRDLKKRVCAYLVDIFIELNYDFMTTSPVEELNALFKDLI